VAARPLGVVGGAVEPLPPPPQAARAGALSVIAAVPAISEMSRRVVMLVPSGRGRLLVVVLNLPAVLVGVR
jgi:hypothetical protein